MTKKLLLPITFWFLFCSFAQAFLLKQEPVKPKTEKNKKNNVSKKTPIAVSLSDEKEKIHQVKGTTEVNEDGTIKVAPVEAPKRVSKTKTNNTK